MNILAFETSCDETAVAVVRDGREILSNVVSSQVNIHALYGGVVPEIASRKHMEVLAALSEQAMREARCDRDNIDAVAVTHTPGLIGALLVGVNFAKGVACSWEKPLIPVHHLRGHMAAAYVTHPELAPPFICLVASGGHTELLDVRDYTDIRPVGATCDDAAGEVFDKVARALGLGYPGGAALSRLAESGNDQAYKLPRSRTKEPFDFSFSGLKTAALSVINQANMKGEKVDSAGLAASFERVVCEELVSRTVALMEQVDGDRLVLCGGVAANARLRRSFSEAFESRAALFMPTLALCGDNAAMIASQAFYEFRAGVTADLSLNASANRSV